MSLKSGETVFFKLLPEIVRHPATVLSTDDETVVIEAPAARGIATGSHLIISSGDRQYFAEVTAVRGDTVTARQTWSNSREYFRVDDVVPLVARKVDMDPSMMRSRVFPAYDAGITDAETPDASVSPQLWRMLVNISNMLGMILERLDLEGEGLMRAERRRVNVSATGMRFRSGERYDLGDSVEVKMLLPTHPPLGVLTYGTVVRVAATDDGEHDVALNFTDMDDELREDIIRYALKRQREILRRSRE